MANAKLADMSAVTHAASGTKFYADDGTIDGFVLHNLAATAAPTVSNDNTQGYKPGSEWHRPLRGEVWRCIDATTGAAVWRLFSHRLTGFAPVLRMTASVGATNVTGFGPYGQSYDGTAAAGPTVTDQPYAYTATSDASTGATAWAGTGFVTHLPAFPASGNRKLPPMAVSVKFGVPDASYGSGSTGVRVAAGIAAYGTPQGVLGSAVGGNGAANEGVFVRYDTSAGDSNWQVVSRTDATPGNAVVADTGEAFSANSADLLDFTVITEEPGRLRWVLYRAGTDSYRTGLITAVPSGVGFQWAGAALKTLGSTARALRFASVSVLERAA